MCVVYEFVNNEGVTDLTGDLGVDPNELLFSEVIRPGHTISIITDREERKIVPAVWWMYLQQVGEELKPNPKLFSVNSNWKKLPTRPEYKYSRCIIPATGFIESQNGKRPHLLKPADGSAIAFGGLFKENLNKVTGEVVYSAAIITLAGHPALKNIHEKSTPLWLPESIYGDWLNPGINDPRQFKELLEPSLRTDLMATPISKSTVKEPIGDSFLVSNN